MDVSSSHPPLALAADGDGCHLSFSLLYLCQLLGFVALLDLPHGKVHITTRSVSPVDLVSRWALAPV